jgi:hypothetical protein
VLTVLTQSNPSTSGEDIAAARSKLVITSSMTILAAARVRKVYSLHAPEVECIGKAKRTGLGAKVGVGTTMKYCADG